MVVLSAEAQAALEVLKALCRSRKSPPSINELVREYRELEGRDIRFPGFSNAEELIKASNELSVKYVNGIPCVVAKISEQTAHITEMIRAQKCAKRKPAKRGGGFNSAPKQYSTSFWGQSGPKVAPKKTFNYRPVNRGPPRPLNKRMNNNSSMANYNVTGGLSHLKLISPGENYSQPQKFSSGQKTNLLPSQQAKVIMPTSSPPPKKEAENNSRPRMEPPMRHTMKPKQSSRTLLSPSMIRQPPPGIYRSDSPGTVITPTLQPARNETPVNLNLKIEPLLQYEPVPIVSPIPGIVKPSVQERLKKIPKQSINDTNTGEPTTPTTPITTPTTPITTPTTPVEEPPVVPYVGKMKVTIPDTWWDNTQLPAAEKLALYCKISNIQEPQYEFFKVRDGKVSKWGCRVTVNDLTFSTYPEDFPSCNNAKEYVTNLACETLKRSDETSQPQSEFIGTNEQLLQKLFEVLSRHPNGVFMSKIPALVQNEDNFVVPDNYKSLIEEFNFVYFRTEFDSTTGDNLVFAKEDMAVPESGLELSGTNEHSAETLPPPIQLPWDEKQWYLHIMDAQTTADVWAKLIGPDYHTKLEELHNKLEMAPLTLISSPPVVDKYYIVVICSCPARVKVTELSENEKKAKCFSIDTGEQVWLEWSQLCECDDTFLQLPAQAFKVSIHGLEMFSVIDDLNQMVRDKLDGRTFVVEPMIEIEYYDPDNLILPIVIWDTSTDEDVNMNVSLLEAMKPKLSLPSLNSKSSVNLINITGVVENGEIACQLRENEMDLIDFAIEFTVQSLKLDNYRGVYIETTVDGLYLVYDETDQKWYRAKIIDLIDAEKLKFNLIDFALERTIRKTNIFRLKDMSLGLNAYPAQGLRLKLHKAPKMTHDVLCLLRGMIGNQTEGICKVNTTDTSIPEVTLYFSQPTGLFLVNDALRTQLNWVPCEPDLSSNGTVRPTPAVVEVPDKQLQQFTLPKVGENFDVRIVVVETPNRFYVQPMKCAKAFTKMTQDLQRYCSKAERIPLKDVVVKQDYAATQDEEQVWCRVTVLQIFDKCDLISVYYCDFGKIDVICLKNIRKLPVEFRNLPKQAILAKLHGVKPKDGNQYSSEAAVRFNSLVQDKVLQSIVRGVKEIKVPNIGQNEIVSLELVDVETKSESDIFIAKKLIEEDLVAPAIERI